MHIQRTVLSATVQLERCITVKCTTQCAHQRRKEGADFVPQQVEHWQRAVERLDRDAHLRQSRAWQATRA
jgi:hypothetical protein